MSLKFPPFSLSFSSLHVQVECFVVLRYPRVALRLRRVLTFLVGQLRTTHGHFDVRTEHTRRAPLQTIGSHHYTTRLENGRRVCVSLPTFNRHFMFTTSRMSEQIHLKRHFAERFFHRWSIFREREIERETRQRIERMYLDLSPS